MSTATRVPFYLLGAVLLSASIAACDTAPGPSLYDPIQDGSYRAPKPDPKLLGIAPAVGQALAGVTELTLTGENFVPSPDSTYVYFNGTRYPVRSITPTEIRMRAPNLPVRRDAPNDSLRIRVSVLRAEHFSQTLNYQLLPAVERIGALESAERPFGVTTDPETGRIFVSLSPRNIDVLSMDDPEEREEAVATAFQMAAMDLAGEYLYTVRSVNGVFRFRVPGGSQEVVGSISDRTVSLLAVAHDEDGYTWVGGSKSSAGPRFLYRFDANRAVETFSFEGTVRGIEDAPGALYVLAEREGVTGIWRLPRTAGTLGAEELVYSLPASFAGRRVLSFVRTADGGFLLGTDNVDPLLHARPDGTTVAFHEGLLRSPTGISSLAWLPDGRLVVSGANAVGNTDSEQVGADLLVVTTLLDPQL